MTQKQITRGVMILCVALGGVFIFWDMGKMPMSEAPKKEITRHEIKTTISDFVFKDFAGKKQHLRDFKGRVVVLNFWASWCAPCLEEFPSLVALAAHYPKTLSVLTISVDVDAGRAQRFIKKLGRDRKIKNIKNIIFAHDPDRVIAQDIFQTTKFPESFIIDADGRLLQKIQGARDWIGEDMLGYFKSITGKDNGHGGADRD